MAVIEKIRTKYGKLAAGVIVVALVGFIFMDAASGRFGDLLGHDSSVIKVNGEKVDGREYSERTKEYETLVTLYGQNPNIDEATRAQINEQMVNMLVYEKVATAQCEKLGIATTDKEKSEMIYSADADRMVQAFKIQGSPVFANPETGMFDPQRVKAFEQQVGQIDPTGKLKDEWQMVKSYVIRSNDVNKFNDLFVKSVYVPKYLLMHTAQEQDNQASISYVKVPFTTVNDNEVKVTDEDLKAYMQKHAAMYTAYEPTRNIEYVSFDIAPNKEDTDRTVSALAQIKNDFATAKDNENFVIRNSDENAKPTFVTKKSFMSPMADSILNQPVGTVVGPYLENSNYKLVKVVDKKVLPDTVKCRHILISIKAQGHDLVSDSVAKNRIDSIAAAIKAGANFDTLAIRMSNDEGSAKNGGVYTFTMQQKQGMSKEFADFIFEGKTGESKIVKVSNDNYTGYHYIEILDQKGIQPATEIAIISKALYAGDNTVTTAYARASEFAGKNSTAAAFDEAVKKENLNKRIGDNIKPSNFTIPGIGPAREVIRWTYEAEINAVSPVFNLDGRYVVAKLVSIQNKGLMPITTSMRPMLEAAVKNEKKADLIANKYKGNTLQALAQAAGQQVQKADSISFGASYIPGLGYEPKVLGYAFYTGLQPNTVSPAIKAQDGVLFISVASRWNKASDPHTMEMMAGQQRMMQEMQTKNAVGEQLQTTLIRNATIKYNTANF